MSIKTWANKFIHSNRILPSIGLVSFLESTVVPIPLEVLLVPLMQARREKLWLIALVTTIGCLLGAMVFYGVGYFLFESLQHHLVSSVTAQQQFEEFTQRMQTDGFLLLFSTGVTPLPLQIATLAAGVTSYNLLLFIAGTTLGRIVRYFGLAALVYLVGDRAEAIVKQYHWQLAIAGVALVAALWWLAS